MRMGGQPCAYGRAGGSHGRAAVGFGTAAYSHRTAAVFVRCRGRIHVGGHGVRTEACDKIASIMRARWVIAGVLSVLFACKGGESPTDPAASLRCANPAPYHPAEHPVGDGYLVFLQPGLDTTEVTNRLAAKYHFTPTAVATHLGVFVANFNTSTRESLRCEPEVTEIDEDDTLHAAGRSPGSGHS